MNTITQSRGKGIVVATLVGAAIGAGVALLCAPCSGKEAREWLTERVRDVGETVKT